MNSLFSTILKLSISATLVIIIILIVRHMIKNKPKFFSYALWAIVFFKLVCPFSFEIKGEIIPKELHGAIAAHTFDISVDKIFNSENTEYVPTENFNDLNENKIITYSNFKFRLWQLWILGIIIVASYCLIDLKKVYDETKYAKNYKDNIFILNRIQSPFVFNFLIPRIFIPDNLSKSQIEYIILHEKTHIKRFDHILKPIAFIIVILHWFNPLVWISFFLMIQDMEMSCDEAVIRKKGYISKKDYSYLLLSFASKRNNISVANVLFSENNSEKRIKNILKYKKPSKTITLLLTTFLVIVGVALFTAPKDEQPPIIEPIPTATQPPIEDKEDAGVAVSTGDEGNVEEDSGTEGKFKWPTDEDLMISRGFVGEYPLHNGIDIIGELGAEIYAAEKGRVLKAIYSNVGYGNYLIIEHENSITTLYSKCKELKVAIGDEVEKGQLIATMGSTGNSTGVHLHFEIRKDDITHDPYEFFEKTEELRPFY